MFYIGDSTVARSNIHFYPQTGMFHKDNTHLKPEGAVVMAGFLAEGLRNLSAPYACLLADSDEGAHA